MKLPFTLLVALAGSANSQYGTYSGTCDQIEIATGTCVPYCSTCCTIASFFANCVKAVFPVQADATACTSCVLSLLVASVSQTCSVLNGEYDFCQRVLECPCYPCDVAALDWATCEVELDSAFCFIQCNGRSFPHTTECFDAVREGCNCGLFRKGDKKCLYSEVKDNDIAEITNNVATLGACELPIFLDQAQAFVEEVRKEYRDFCRVPP